MCRLVDESSSHLFFTCDVAMGVWNMCNKWVGVSNVNHFMPRQHFNHFYLFGIDGKQNNAWKCMWMAVVWVIWKQRNNIIFSSGTIDNIEMFTVAQLKTWGWITTKFPKAELSYSDWCLNPLSCLKSIR